METDRYDVIIIGAGAAGLMCACALFSLQPSMKVLIIERNSKPGRKLLATGNGRCNFTNTNESPEAYYTDDVRKMSSILYTNKPSKVIDFFENRIGVIAHTTDEGLVYPITFQSKTVANALSSYPANARFVYDTEVTGVVKGKDMDFIVNGSYRGDNVVFACGGMSHPELGSNGSLLRLIGDLAGKDSIESPVPSLVPLKTSDRSLKKLSGLRQECEVFIGGHKERGEIQFTDSGISGICVMQLSGFYNRSIRHGDRPDYASVNLLPSMNPGKRLKTVKSLLRNFSRKSQPEALSGLLKLPIAEAVVQRSDKSPQDISRIIGDFRIPLSGSLGFDMSQVTSGGLKLKFVNNGLELLNCPGVYVCGEALNVDGICGGYNLQWAWASAMTVAESVFEEFEGI